MTPAPTSADARPDAGMPTVSIVVPTLNEGPAIAGHLTRLLGDFRGCELVVADGGSTDGTVEAAGALVPVVRAERGRGQQLNAGAAATSGEVLWFVHADTRLDPAALPQLRAALADPAVVGGGLTLRFDGTGPALRYLQWSSNQRARRLGLVFGDQAMFVRRRAFDDLGGFPAIPLMEDLELSRRLARCGRLAVVAATSTASTRRFDRHGTWRMIAFMQYLKVLHLAGVDAGALAWRYEAGPGLRLPPGALRRRPAATRAAAGSEHLSDRATSAPAGGRARSTA
ncbi:MAG TPA: TIGR04283 family arsenosugar biosynthesis glycosyltransferase [Acidimicrobiales bacterium]|nr:TIGR04283 family arsenosugar biosynthesis glycosyltransferase [Acidimicrobiales bacterium]